VGHVVYPPTKVTSIAQTLTVLDYNTSMPVAGVDICMSYDCQTCGSAGQVFAMGTTDMNGLWKGTLPLPPVGAFGATQPTFQGCVRFSSPDITTEWGYEGFPQTNAMWSLPPAYTATTVTADEFAMDVMAIGEAGDPSRAQISMRAFDCLGTPATGVQFASGASDAMTTIWYSGVNTTTPLSEPTTNATNSSGLAIVFHVPAPDAGAVNVSLTATPVGLGKPSSRESVSVRAGIDSIAQMTPTP
jgi:hypothetical protein